MVEVHPTPDQALSDAEQQLDLDQFRDLMADARPGPRAGPRPRTASPIRGGGRPGIGAAGWRSTERDARRRRRHGPAGRAAARRAAPARRQVDQPSRADLGDAGRRREPRSRGAGDGADVRSTAGVMRALGAHRSSGSRDDGRTVDYRVVSPGADGLDEPDDDPRLRQLRDEPAAHRRACSPACP